MSLCNKKVIGFVNGCFDLLHYGHINLLWAASRQCDQLFVAVNDDESIEALKGRKPIMSAAERVEAIGSLPFVYIAQSFVGSCPNNLIENLRPDIVFRSPEYADSPTKALVESYGGKYVIIPRTEGISTSDIIKRIKELPC